MKKKKRRRTPKQTQQIIKVTSATPEIVAAITERLIKTYEDYLNEHPQTNFVDGFMAAHNLHAAIICHLTNETEDKEGHIYKMAKDTFTLRMEKELRKIEEKKVKPKTKPTLWRKNDYIH